MTGHRGENRSCASGAVSTVPHYTNHHIRVLDDGNFMPMTHLSFLSVNGRSASTSPPVRIGEPGKGKSSVVRVPEDWVNNGKLGKAVARFVPIHCFLIKKRYYSLLLLKNMIPQPDLRTG
jgi:hypothetical protein